MLSNLRAPCSFQAQVKMETVSLNSQSMWAHLPCSRQVNYLKSGLRPVRAFQVTTFVCSYTNLSGLRKTKLTLILRHT